MPFVRLAASQLAICAALAMSVSLSASSSAAQSPQPASSPADDFIRRQAQQDLQQRLDALRQATPRTSEGEGTEEPKAVSGKGPCFKVRHVEVEDVTLLSPRTLEPLLSSYRDRCIDLSDINILLKGITNLYLDEGYITSRVYVPEQNIAETGILRLVAAEGALSDIYLNGKPAKEPGVLATAFPGMKGSPVNIRDMEQGLDQINRLSSNNARTSMMPGGKPGTSILNVENKPDNPWHFSLTNNNLGQKSTGYSKTSMGFRMDNLFALNDLISLNYEHSGPDYPWPDDGIGQGNSFSGAVSVPYGYWTFTLNGSYYKYRSSVPGNFGDIDTSGSSGEIGFNVDRVILRDADSITTLNAGLRYKQIDNFLMGSRIEVGSREYSVAGLGLSHSRHMLDGLWVFSLNYDHGLDIFGATRRGEPGAGDAEPKFRKFTGTISVMEPFQISGQNFQFSTMVNGQYSPDNLYGAEQISLGGYSNVRGVRDSLLFGNSGVFTRNEIAWRTVPWKSSTLLTKRFGELRPYAAIDYGHTFRQQRFGLPGGDISSWTVGARLVGGSMGADIGYSRLIASTSDTRARDLFFVSTSLQW